MAEGIAHSREHYAEDEQSIPILYATQMHEMAQYLIDMMNPVLPMNTMSLFKGNRHGVNR